MLTVTERLECDLLLKAASHGVIRDSEGVTAKQAIDRAKRSSDRGAKMFLLYNRAAIAELTSENAHAPRSASPELAKALDIRPLLAMPVEQGVAPVNHRFEIIIKSFRRFGSLLRCVVSINRRYLGVRMIIADDSFETIPEVLPPEIVKIQSFPEVDWHWLPFDSGLSVGRNHLVKQTTAPIIFNFDDDFLVTEETDLEAMARVIEQDSAVGLLGGLVRTGGVVRNWCGHLKRDLQNRTLKINPLRSPWKQVGEAAYRQTDLAFNFFAARRAALQENPWDDRFKIIGEHLDHFLGMHKNVVGVYYTKSSIVAHIHDQPKGYKAFRNRKEYMQPLLAKWGLAEPPNHLAIAEPGFQKRDMAELVRKALEVAANPQTPRSDWPNVVVLGVGHSNTSITTRQLHALGWKAGDADEEFAESVSVRAVNIEFLKTGEFPAGKARQVLAALPRPWAIKDPRFCRTLPHWLDAMRGYAPFLLWIKKDLQTVKNSFLRRGEDPRRAPFLFDKAKRIFQDWPLAKLAVNAEDIGRAAALFDLQREKGGILNL